MSRVTVTHTIPIESTAVVAEAHAIPLEASTTVIADLFLVSFDQLPRELKQRRREIIVKLPAWCPRLLVYPLALVVLVAIAAQGILAFEGLTYGYNVEFCPKLIIKGVEISGCLKLTKPNP
jgi:hypothetical protein